MREFRKTDTKLAALLELALPSPPEVVEGGGTKRRRGRPKGSTSKKTRSNTQTAAAGGDMEGIGGGGKSVGTGCMPSVPNLPLHDCSVSIAASAQAGPSSPALFGGTGLRGSASEHGWGKRTGHGGGGGGGAGRDVGRREAEGGGTGGDHQWALRAGGADESGAARGGGAGAAHGTWLDFIDVCNADCCMW